MRLKERREALGLTQRQAAAAVGVTPEQMCNYENGGYKPKTLAAVKMAELYGCTVEDIMSDPSDGPHDTPPAVP